MEVYKMDAKLRDELTLRLKSKNPTWLKWRWLYYSICALIIVAFIAIAILSFDGTFDLEYFEILAMFALSGAILVLIPLAMFRAILRAPALFPNFGKEVIISFQENSLTFLWSTTPYDIDDPAFQYNQETRIIMNYGAIKRITYNRTLERLEVYGDFEHQKRESNWYNSKTSQLSEWSEWKDNKDADYFVRKKNENILHIYNYFPNMQDLMNRLERVSGHVIEYHA